MQYLIKIYRSGKLVTIISLIYDKSLFWATWAPNYQVNKKAATADGYARALKHSGILVRDLNTAKKYKFGLTFL